MRSEAAAAEAEQWHTASKEEREILMLVDSDLDVLLESERNCFKSLRRPLHNKMPRKPMGAPLALRLDAKTAAAFRHIMCTRLSPIFNNPPPPCS